MLKNKKFKIEKINTNLLHSGLVYQRKVTNSERVKNIASNWSKALFEYPCVSLRNGVYNVIDGQHTIAAFKMRFGTNSEILCKVGYGLTEADENEWFELDAVKSKKQTCKTIYQARLNKGTDKILNSLMFDLKKCNLYLGIDMPNGDGVINSLVGIEKIYKSMKSVDFISCFSILQKTWDGNKNSLRDDFIKGMVKFYNTYRNKFDEKRFIKALSRILAEDIKQEVNSDRSKLPLNIKYARVFATYYNFNLRKLPKLKISELED